MIFFPETLFLLASAEALTSLATGVSEVRNCRTEKIFQIQLNIFQTVNTIYKTGQQTP